MSIPRYWIDRTDVDVPHKSDDGEMVFFADHIAAITPLVLALRTAAMLLYGFGCRKKSAEIDALLAEYEAQCGLKGDSHGN